MSKVTLDRPHSSISNRAASSHQVNSVDAARVFAGFLEESPGTATKIENSKLGLVILLIAGVS